MQYPVLNMGQQILFRTILLSAQADPNYLTHPDCPYDADFIAAIKSVSPKASSPPRGVSEINLISDIEEFYERLKDFGDLIDQNDIQQQMTWFKTVTNLSERLIELRKDAQNEQQFARMQQVVFDFVVDNLTPDLLNDLQQKLEAAKA